MTQRQSQLEVIANLVQTCKDLSKCLDLLKEYQSGMNARVSDRITALEKEVSELVDLTAKGFEEIAIYHIRR